MRPLLVIAVLCLAGAVHGADTKTTTTTNATAAFARLKTLIGEWDAVNNGSKAHVTYELIANGTAVLERYAQGTDAPMITIYHINGDRLMLTHYCMAGNQPRMLARSYNAETGELQFDFLDATNLASPDDGHMHTAKIRIVDNNHVSAVWQYFEKGQAKFTEDAKFTRVK